MWVKTKPQEYLVCSPVLLDMFESWVPGAGNDSLRSYPTLPTCER